MVVRFMVTLCGLWLIVRYMAAIVRFMVNCALYGYCAVYGLYNMYLGSLYTDNLHPTLYLHVLGQQLQKGRVT